MKKECLRGAVKRVRGRNALRSEMQVSGVRVGTPEAEGRPLMV
jgi:hypothetical protein